MDVVVVGAGIVGCAVAHELAGRGARVTVLEGRDVGQGASRASAGVLCPHIEGHAGALLHLGARSLALYDAFIDRVRADSGIGVEYRRTGTLEVAVTERQAAALREAAGRYQRDGVTHAYLDAHSARELEPGLSERVTGALLVPTQGYVAVQALTTALAEAARARGAVVERGADVREIASNRGRVRIALRNRTVGADAVVIAAGSWSGLLPVDGVAPPVKPIRGQLLHLAFAAPPASRVIWGAECYLVPWQDGSLLVGATSEDVGFDESATVAGVRGLLEHACELLPAARRARFEGVRVGLRPATGDELPVIGPSSSAPGVFYATGHYRNGVLLAPFTAMAVADLVLEGRAAPELELTRPNRFGL